MLAPGGADTAGMEVTEDPRDTDAQPVPRDAAKPKPQVPTWREELAWSVLSVGYQRVPQRSRTRVDSVKGR